MFNGVIGIDPGAKNFALSILEGGNCIGTELVPKTIYKLGGPEIYHIIQEYEDYMCSILDKAQPRAVVIERFIVRGFGANSIELVTFMVATLKKLCDVRKIAFYMVTAAQWKKAVKRQLDLKQLYKQYWAKPYRIPPHIIDSLLIGRFYFNDKKYSQKDELWIHETLQKLPPALFPKPRFKFYLRNRVVF